MMISKIFLCSLLLFLNAMNGWAITVGIAGHKAGDVIALRMDDEIAKYCSFNKQIVITQLNVLCVYNGNDSDANDF